MIDHGFAREETGDSVCVRGRSLSFQVYCDGVLHHDHPAVEISLDPSGPTVVWADSYDDLLGALDKLRVAIEEHRKHPR